MHNTYYDVSKNFLPYFTFLEDRKQFNSQIEIFNSALYQWTQRPLLGRRLNMDYINFYDAIIGCLIRVCNQEYVNSRNKTMYDKEAVMFMNFWMYKGYMYRVIDCPLSKIRFHKKIASWTKSINAIERFNKIGYSKKYTFIVAKTPNDYFGFDVNKYNEIRGVGAFTAPEEEVIFPMDKKYVVCSFYGTLNEFRSHINTFFKECL